MRSNVIDVEGMVHHQTEKAVLFSTTGNRKDAEWLPKSQIELGGQHPIWIVTIPEQLALEKGLI